MRKLLSVAIAIAIAMIPVATCAGTGITDDHTHETIAFIADVHNQNDNKSAERTLSVMSLVAAAENDYLDQLCDCGDIGSAWDFNEPGFWQDTEQALDTIDSCKYLKNKPAIHIAGNHEWSNGHLSTTKYAAAKRIIKTVGTVVSDPHYEIFCFGATSGQELYKESDIELLDKYLASKKGSSKPIFIISHYPLHRADLGYSKNSDLVIDTINKYAGNLCVTYVWGHNHTILDNDAYYDTVRTPHSIVEGQEILFNYAAAGVMSDKGYVDTTLDIKAKTLVASIDNKTGVVSLRFYTIGGDAFGDTVIRDAAEGQIGPALDKLPTVKSVKLNRAKKSLKISWKKFVGDERLAISGIQIKYSKKKSMKNAKTVKATKTATYKKLTNLKAGKKYYVKVRTYYTDSNGTCYSKWSTRKTVK